PLLAPAPRAAGVLAVASGDRRGGRPLRHGAAPAAASALLARGAAGDRDHQPGSESRSPARHVPARPSRSPVQLRGGGAGASRSAGGSADPDRGPAGRAGHALSQERARNEPRGSRPAARTLLGRKPARAPPRAGARPSIDSGGGGDPGGGALTRPAARSTLRALDLQPAPARPRDRAEPPHPRAGDQRLERLGRRAGAEDQPGRIEQKAAGARHEAAGRLGTAFAAALRRERGTTRRNAIASRLPSRRPRQRHGRMLPFGQVIPRVAAV